MAVGSSPTRPTGPVQQTGRGRPRTYDSIACRRKAERQAAEQHRTERHRRWLADVEAGAVDRPWWLRPEAADVVAELS